MDCKDMYLVLAGRDIFRYTPSIVPKPTSLLFPNHNPSFLALEARKCTQKGNGEVGGGERLKWRCEYNGGKRE